MRWFLFFSLLFLQLASAEPKKVALFVALCDNASQGIVPVPARIGDGNKPSENLYWGNSEGFAGCFGTSKNWKLQKKETPEDTRILERRIYLDASGKIEITAEAWRGNEIRACLTAFETSLTTGNYDLCAYIGHNVLMDGPVLLPIAKAGKPCDAIVLCCMSSPFFKARLTQLGARPVLLTTQLMYPGSFLLKNALPVWANGGSLSEIRQAAASAYSQNQKISQKAAKGVFAELP